MDFFLRFLQKAQEVWQQFSLINANKWSFMLLNLYTNSQVQVTICTEQDVSSKEDTVDYKSNKEGKD